MRKLTWIGAAVGVFLVWAFVSAPPMRFRPVPAPEPPQAMMQDRNAPSLDAIRSAGRGLSDVELTRVERVPSGVIEVDVHFEGSRPPESQEGWNLLAKEIANELAQTPANTQTIRVFLYHGNELRSEAVTTRSE